MKKNFSIKQPEPGVHLMLSAITEVEKDYYFFLYEKGLVGSICHLAGFMIFNQSELWSKLEKRHDKEEEIPPTQLHKLWAYSEFDEFLFGVCESPQTTVPDFFENWRKQIVKEYKNQIKKTQ